LPVSYYFPITAPRTPIRPFLIEDLRPTLPPFHPPSFHLFLTRCMKAMYGAIFKRPISLPPQMDSPCTPSSTSPHRPPHDPLDLRVSSLDSPFETFAGLLSFFSPRDLLPKICYFLNSPILSMSSRRYRSTLLTSFKGLPAANLTFSFSFGSIPPPRDFFPLSLPSVLPKPAIPLDL